MKLVILLVVIVITAICFLFYCKSGRNASNKVTKEFQYGPFTIRVTATSGKTLNMNYGLVNYTNVGYAVLHAGKPVAFPGALENNTGLPFMWKVYALPGAPDPTLIAGSQSLYMIYLKNGQVVAEPLLQQSSDFASLQFLDSEAGQPGPFKEVFMEQEVSNLEQLDSLQGGRFLMIGEHAVLEVPTRRLWPFNKNNESIDNYSFPTPHGALAFSPDRKSIVFHANFDSWNTATEDLPESEHALVAYDFEKNQGYVVPYDDTDTRMINVNEADLNWFNAYFEWVRQSDDFDRLQLRRLDKLPNWSGRYDERDNYYYLYPVQPGMLPVFLDFVLDQMGWTKANILKDEFHEYTGRRLDLGAGDIKLDICLKEDEQQLTFSQNLYVDKNPEYQRLVKKIADAFNAELAAGKHQEHFGRIFNATKKIRGG